MQLVELASYLDDYLASKGAEDFGPNGLQVDGRSEVQKVVTGVSACHELFKEAIARGADTVLVHHGLIWGRRPQPITGFHHRRLAALIRNDVSLLAYHLPLDRHPEVGNNAVAMRSFGVHENLMPFAEFGGATVGFHGPLPQPLEVEAFLDRCEEIFQQRPLLVGSGPPEIKTVGIVSGGGEDVLHEAIELGLDAYITGEIKEWVQNVAREAGIHYLAAGHYATERLGILALGAHLADRFEIEVEFVDVPNPI